MFKTIIVNNLTRLRKRPMCFTFSKSSVKNMQGVHPDLIRLYMESIKVSPIDFGVPSSGGLRTQGEQNLLFQNGKSKCDGFNDKSNHQAKDDGLGYALDFYAYVDGKASWNNVHLSIIAGVIMATAKRLKKEGKISIKIKWGGTFGDNKIKYNGWDMPHFEVVV